MAFAGMAGPAIEAGTSVERDGGVIAGIWRGRAPVGGRIDDAWRWPDAARLNCRGKNPAPMAMLLP